MLQQLTSCLVECLLVVTMLLHTSRHARSASNMAPTTAFARHFGDAFNASAAVAAVAAAFVVGVLTSTSGSATAIITWYPRRVETKQGTSLSVTCIVRQFERMTVVRVERRDEDQQTRMVLTDNGDVKAPFAGHPRYRVDFVQVRDIGNVTVHYSQIRGEDAGMLACYKLTNTVDEDSVATLELRILVPVRSVRLSTISSDGRERPVGIDEYYNDDYDGEFPSSAVQPSITLTEAPASDKSFRPPGGVSCVASVNGSLTPPGVRMMIDSRDVTGQFAVTEQSRIVEETGSEAARSRGGGQLGIYCGEKRLTYSTSTPDAMWNGRTLSCVASQDGYSDTIATTRVVVYYSPQVTCRSNEVAVELDAVVRVVCKVKANPSPEVTWYFFNKNETIDNSTSGAFVTLLKVDDGGSAGDDFEAAMLLAAIDLSHLGVYQLSTANRIGVLQTKINVRLRRDKSASVRERDNVQQQQQPRGQPIIGDQNAFDVTSATNCRTISTAFWTSYLLLIYCHFTRSFCVCLH